MGTSSDPAALPWVLSARTPAALTEQAAALAAYVQAGDVDPVALARALSGERSAFEERAVVVAEDRAPLHAAMMRTLRASRLDDKRFTSTGLTPADADGLLPEVLELLSEPRSNQEAERLLAERHSRRWPTAAGGP